VTAKYSIIVPTYGDRDYWGPLAERAMASVEAQTFRDFELIRCHGEDIRSTRNYGGFKASGEWLVFLDADDELDSNYLENSNHGFGDIRQPLIVFSDENGVMQSIPFYISPGGGIQHANYIVIGAPVRRDLFVDSGGFDDYPVFEDWALWLKLVKHGATLGMTAGVYIIHDLPGNRNGTNVPGIADRVRGDWGS